MVLKDSPSNKKRKPLGKLPPLSEEELDALAVITPADIEAARAAWRGRVPDRYANLIDAKQVEQT